MRENSRKVVAILHRVVIGCWKRNAGRVIG